MDPEVPLGRILVVYMYAYADIGMKCELASVSHEKKVEMRYEKERVVVYN